MPYLAPGHGDHPNGYPGKDKEEHDQGDYWKDAYSVYTFKNMAYHTRILSKLGALLLSACFTSLDIGSQPLQVSNQGDDFLIGIHRNSLIL